jgi:hypothetical protein
MTSMDMHVWVGYPELTHLEWRSLDGTVLQTAVAAPGMGMSGLLNRREQDPWLDDYELYVRPVSSGEWLRVLLVEPGKATVSRFDV